MESIKIAFLILAYSLGIATLMIQIVCYLKDLEYKETLFFTIVFILLIMATTWQSVLKTGTPLILYIQDLVANMLTLVFAISIPMNIHKERLDRNRKVRNIVVVALGVTVACAAFWIYSTGRQTLVVAIISAYLMVSVVYSMMFILLTKPGARIKTREKSERLIAAMVLFAVSVGSVLFLLQHSIITPKLMQQNGGIILAIICIILSISKIITDVKKLIQSDQSYTIDGLILAELGFTQREHEVIRLLITGRTYKEIASELFISLPTVKTHVSNIYTKANVRNRLELSNLVR